jgi:hypothetical protein
MSNPRLGACVLRAIQHWQFPPQPPGGADGSYTVVVRQPGQARDI